MFSISAAASSRSSGNVANDDRDLEQPGALRCAPAALAGDDLVAAVGPADDDRLDDAVRAGSIARARRCGSSSIVRAAGTCWAAADRCRRRATFRRAAARGRIGDERAQTAAERRTFVSHAALLPARTRGARSVAREDLAGEREIRLGAARFHVVEDRGHAVARRLAEPDVARDDGGVDASPGRTRGCRARPAGPRFVRSSCIVSSTPAMSSDGLSAARTRRSVATRSASPRAQSIRS